MWINRPMFLYRSGSERRWLKLNKLKIPVLELPLLCTGVKREKAGASSNIYHKSSLGFTNRSIESLSTTPTQHHCFRLSFSVFQQITNACRCCWACLRVTGWPPPCLFIPWLFPWQKYLMIIWSYSCPGGLTSVLTSCMFSSAHAADAPYLPWNSERKQMCEKDSCHTDCRMQSELFLETVTWSLKLFS